MDSNKNKNNKNVIFVFKIVLKMEVFNMKKITDVAEIEDYIRQSSEKESYNDKVMFFVYDKLAFERHEPKGLPITYVLQIDDQTANQLDYKNEERNDENESCENREENSKKNVSGIKKRRSRVTYSPVELSILEDNFTDMLQQGPCIYSKVVEKLNLYRPYSKLTIRHIKNWVSNKKQKLIRNQQCIYNNNNKKKFIL